MNRIERVQKLRKWPGAFGIGNSLEASTAYFLGWDAATDGAFLAGFREWLVIRLEGGTNLGWPALLAKLTASTEDVRLILSHEAIADESSVRSKMFDLLEEFLRDRDETRSLDAILEQYEQWKEQNQ